MSLRATPTNDLYVMIDAAAKRRDQEDADIYHAIGAILKTVLEIKQMLENRK